MAVTTFAAIDISSYEITMKIFEFSKKGGFRTVDDIRYRLNLGVGVYSGGTMEVDKVDTICEVLNDFKRIMAEYGVKDYRACTTSVFREMKNPLIIIEQIFRRTGIHVEVLSNAEQHFLGYKSIAAIENGFKKMIQKGTAILDVGGGNLQISLFDKDALVTTQSLKMGSVRIRQRLKELEKTNTNYAQLVEEFIRNDLTGFKRLYLKDREIKNLILMGDFLTETIFREERQDNIITRAEFEKRYENTVYKTETSLSEEMDIDPEYAALIVPTMVKILWIFSMQKRFGCQVYLFLMALPMISGKRRILLRAHIILKMIFWWQPETLPNVILLERIILRVLPTLPWRFLTA